MIPKDILAKLSLFEGLPASALDEIGALAKGESFPSRATIFSPEQASKDIYVLLAGSVRLTVFASPMSEPVTITVLKTPGQAFSFSSVIGSGHHNSSAEAITDVRVIAVEGRPLMDYLAKEPAEGFLIMKRVAYVISQRLAALRRLLAETITDYERPPGVTPEN